MCGGAQQTEMSDKSLETDIRPENKCNSRNPNENKEKESDAMHFERTSLPSNGGSKICPMCGIVFDAHVAFEVFCEHVEDHFCDDSIDLEYSVERNFEMVSATMGNF